MFNLNDYIFKFIRKDALNKQIKPFCGENKLKHSLFSSFSTRLILAKNLLKSITF